MFSLHFEDQLLFPASQLNLLPHAHCILDQSLRKIFALLTSAIFIPSHAVPFQSVCLIHHPGTTISRPLLSMFVACGCFVRKYTFGMEYFLHHLFFPANYIIASTPLTLDSEGRLTNTKKGRGNLKKNKFPVIIPTINQPLEN